MVNATAVRTDIDNAIKEVGGQITWFTYTKTFSGTDYDDAYRTSGATFTATASLQPIGNSDTSYVEGGFIKFSDKKVYVAGSLAIDTDTIMNYGGDEYKILPKGIEKWNIAGTNVGQKAYVRVRTGSVNIY